MGTNNNKVHHELKYAVVAIVLYCALCVQVCIPSFHVTCLITDFRVEDLLPVLSRLPSGE